MAPRVAADDNLPDQAQLSADMMFFEADSGEFSASGNVVIHADGVTFHAPRGTGNVKSREVHFSDNITVSGVWRGDWLDLSAGNVSFFFSQTPTYIAEGSVSGVLGKLYIDVDKFYMKGADFSALNVRRFEDRELDVAFGAASVSGVVDGGVLTTFTAEGDVWLNGRPNAVGDAVDIKGDKAVYSLERGSIVMSGNVRATQKGRALDAGSLVYFPDSNRIDAYGAHGAPASIKIDMNLERESRQ
jgi:lipopolysaccharide export system protein LptA